MDTFEARKAAVAEHHGPKAKLDEHTCCPECGNHNPHVESYDQGPVKQVERDELAGPDGGPLRNGADPIPDGNGGLKTIGKKIMVECRDSKARPAKDTDAAKCNHCGWKGKFSDLHDTVQAGHTKLPEQAPVPMQAAKATEPAKVAPGTAK